MNFQKSQDFQILAPWTASTRGIRSKSARGSHERLGGGGRPERPRRAAQNVGRPSGAPRVSVIIIQTRCKCPQAMIIDQDRIFAKLLFFEESVVFDRLYVLRSVNLLLTGEIEYHLGGFSLNW